MAQNPCPHSLVGEATRNNWGWGVRRVLPRSAWAVKGTDQKDLSIRSDFSLYKIAKVRKPVRKLDHTAIL